MRELTLHTARVIDRVRQQSKVMMITRHGRLAGFIEPLTNETPGSLLAFAINHGLLGMPGTDSPAATSDQLRTSTPDASASSDSDRKVGIATSRDLSQHPSEVIERVGNGEHLIVTRHGRPVVMLHPFAEGTVARLLSAVPEFVGTPEDGMRDGVGYGVPTSLMAARND